MSQRSHEGWERFYGKGNPTGGNDSDIEEDGELIRHCDWCGKPSEDLSSDFGDDIVCKECERGFTGGPK